MSRAKDQEDYNGNPISHLADTKEIPGKHPEDCIPKPWKFQRMDYPTAFHPIDDDLSIEQIKRDRNPAWCMPIRWIRWEDTDQSKDSPC